MNCNNIKRDYPKAWEEWLKPFNPKNHHIDEEGDFGNMTKGGFFYVYNYQYYIDFFDKQGIYIDAVYNEYARFTVFEVYVYVEGEDKHVYEDGEFSRRIFAKQAGIMAAWELLEKKLTDK